LGSATPSRREWFPKEAAVADARRIAEVTRRRLLDALALEPVAWSGRLDEVAFLGRIYDLDQLPSNDYRYKTAAGDINQHRINNPQDWEDDWVFSDDRFGLQHGDDKVLLRFLSEMLHPRVRPNGGEVERLLRAFNQALAPDGYEIAVDHVISGQDVYAGRERAAFHGAAPALKLEERPLLTDPRVLHEHLDRIRDGLAGDPAAAIASSKELVESLLKIILDRSRVAYPPGDDLLALYRKVADLLNLKAESVPTSARGSRTAQTILRTLTTTVQSLGELRNELGLGHGRAAPSPALARHARLALNSTVALTEFLLDTWEDRVSSGDLILPRSSP
jgi:hypothetical protein